MDAKLTIPKPKNVTFEQAATLGVGTYVRLPLFLASDRDDVEGKGGTKMTMKRNGKGEEEMIMIMIMMGNGPMMRRREGRRTRKGENEKKKKKLTTNPHRRPPP